MASSGLCWKRESVLFQLNSLAHLAGSMLAVMLQSMKVLLSLSRVYNIIILRSFERLRTSIYA